MTTKNNPEHHLVIKCKEITSHFENELSEMIMPARLLSSNNKDQIATELKATIQNINFMLTSLFSGQAEERK
jgi:hypothetical protein